MNEKQKETLQSIIIHGAKALFEIAAGKSSGGRAGADARRRLAESQGRIVRPRSQGGWTVFGPAR